MQLIQLLQAACMLFLAAQDVHAAVKSKGEACRIDVDQCDPNQGLVCYPDDPFSDSPRGTCLKISECFNYGCEIQEGQCTCSYSNSCPWKTYPFLTRNECLESLQTTNCDDIVCPPTEYYHEICPLGSRYIPGPQLPGRCCPSQGTCQCDSELCPAEPECPEGSISFIVHEANETAGECCNQFACKTVTCPVFFGEFTLLQDGDSIIPDFDQCSNFTCISGELLWEQVTCPPLECGENDKLVTLPNECCPVCHRYVVEPTPHELLCVEGDRWRDPNNLDCGVCTCVRGVPECRDQSERRCGDLQLDCENPVRIPGVCCPVCPGDHEEPASTESPMIIVNEEATASTHSLPYDTNDRMLPQDKPLVDYRDNKMTNEDQRHHDLLSNSKRSVDEKDTDESHNKSSKESTSSLSAPILTITVVTVVGVVTLILVSLIAVIVILVVAVVLARRNHYRYERVGKQLEGTEYKLQHV